jgi:ectoine hydroxylase-related dioxygenase (phytanoyl-CoA dioxygenase family)
MTILDVAMTFDEFHGRLDAARRERGPAVVREIGADRQLTFVVDGSAWTYATDHSRLSIERGHHAELTVALDAAAFDDLVHERWSVFGLLYANRLTVARGSFEHFALWEPVLQHLWFDRPLYDDAARAALVDAVGAPLDLTRSFTLADADADIAAFLRVAGFAVVRDVLEAAEVARLNAEVARLRALATPSDGRSWWATDATGREVCCRLTYASLRSEAFASLHHDPRIARIASWHGGELRPSFDRLDGHSVVIKNPAVVSGLSDLPWHRDCGMGGHAVLCPSLNIGLQLDRADAANGQLHYLAGSHHHTNLPPTAEQQAAWPVVAVEAEPGDVTVHYSHVLHVAPPPTASDASRKTVYVGFNNPAIFDVVPVGKGYNDVVFTQGDGRVRSIEELA